MEYRYRTFNFDFMGYRRGFGIFSILITLASIGLLIFPGPKYGIDFAGGTNIIVRFTEDVPVSEIRKAISDSGIEDPSVQYFGAEGERIFLIQTAAVTSIAPEARESMKAAVSKDFGADIGFEYNETSGDRIYLRLPESSYGALFGGSGDADPNNDAIASKATELAAGLTSSLKPLSDSITVKPHGAASDRKFVVQLQSMQSSVATTLQTAFGAKFASVDRVETVGPRAGAQLRNDAMMSAIIALLGILIYVAVRFDFRYAPGAVLVLAHDSLITLGAFVALGKEMNLTILAAVLTLIGYSLNDTIVNFDRIRENLGEKPKESLVDTINRSVNEVLTRTVLTSFTTLVATLAIYLVGGGQVRDFAFAMLFGIIFGTYSSIYVSNSLMLWTSEWVDRRAARRAANSPPVPDSLATP